MQHFSNNPAPPSLPPGFGGRAAGAPPYPPQPADPHISPRMAEDYTAMQQQALHRGHQHPGQAAHMLAYSARNRGMVEPTQASIHSGSSSNPYRKEAMDYYFSMGGKDRHRRGGVVGYGAGFGYPGIDGPIPQQYRHPGSGSASSPGMMSPYPVDYVSTAGSGGGDGGAFSPSHQYSLAQSPAMQSMPSTPLQHRQHGQNYQPLHHGQPQRSYPHAGLRMNPQYPHYSPQGGTPTGSSGMYSPPPQRYHDGTTAAAGFDPKVNSSPGVTSNSHSAPASAAPPNNVGHLEGVQQGYHASAYPAYSPQSHSLHKQATLQHRNSQHNLGASYDTPVKMQPHGPSPASLYAKHHQASNPNIPHAAAQEIARSPMHANAQQTQINQNFSPVSNPSPAASAVQSPNCSSSPSPLMGVSEGHANPAGHPPSHPPTPRGSHGRLLRTMPQLSPTPNSNSSISSCGSSGSHKAQGVDAAMANPSSNSRSRTGTSVGVRLREDGSSVYSSSPLEKMRDAGLNSLNALTSQVANLPNTVQHMLLTDTMFAQKKVKEAGQMQHAGHAITLSQQRSRSASAASSTSTVRDGNGAGAGEGAGTEVGAEEDSSVLSERAPVAKVEHDEQSSEGEHGRARKMSGASSGSETASFYPPLSLNQSQTGQASHGKIINSEPTTKQQGFSEMKPNEAHVASSSSSPSVGPMPAEPTAPVPFTHSASRGVSAPKPNRLPEPGLTDGDNRYGPRKTIEIKKEAIKTEGGSGVKMREKGDYPMKGKGDVNILQDGRDKENRLTGVSNVNSNECEAQQKMSEDQQNVSSVGVIVSIRSEGSHQDKSKSLQDNNVEEKGSQSYSKVPSSHNGEEGVDLSVYSSHHQLHQKPHFGRSQNHPQSAPHKYGYPDAQYGSDIPLKSRGRPGPGIGLIESVSRYPGHLQSQPGHGPAHSKDLVEASLKRVEGAGPRGHEENSQMQQFPSLLQEVLQGYNLDRRYGRPEQAFPPHLQLQQQFQTRHAYGMTGVTEGSLHPSQTASSGKPLQSNHKQATVTNCSTETQPKPSQNAEHAQAGVSQTHLPPPPKHINLADYSLSQKKMSSTMHAPSSAVQELLLQEAEPLAASAGQSETSKSSTSMLPLSSERRSVICDVSPKRRGTPEREGDKDKEREKAQSGASVIQESLASAVVADDLNKKDPTRKQAVKIEKRSDAANPHHSSSSEGHTKPVVINADPYRRSNVDMSPMTAHPTNTNPLSPPTRHQAYVHGFDLTSGHTSGFPGYRYGDSREGNLMPRNPHFPSHHPYHNLSSQVQLPNPQSTNKLQMYPNPCGPSNASQDLSNWVAAMNRPSKEMMMQSASSPGRHKLPNQSEQRQRMLVQAEISPNEQHLAKPPLSHQNAYYDMKMWESAHAGRESTIMMEGDSYYRAAPPPSAAAVSHGTVLPPGSLALSSNTIECNVSRGAGEETKPTATAPASNSTKPSTEGKAVPLQGQRPAKVGGSGDTNPLMLRRRVRSFISPIPAKRQLQEGRGVLNSHHSPGAQSESSHNNEDDSSSSDMACPRLSSPMPGENTYSQSLSPSCGKLKPQPPRKGRGLKLEAIVQKITPSLQKPAGHAEADHYLGFSHSDMAPFSQSQGQDLQHYSRVGGGDDIYLDEGHSLNDMIPFRGVDDAGPLPPSAYPCDPHQTTQVLKQTDFDFGLGAAVVSASGDKEDFALLGPLPPAPPPPRPVQGSPPPSSSALSDIQHFTNTYQQLETRRGEQSAANLLRQKLQETGMGFDDYPGQDYYGRTPPHHSQMLSRHHMSSGRSSLSPQDPKMHDSNVPKGYFPSGKKKGRPVGSVNKHKRAQGPNAPMVPNMIPGAPSVAAPQSPLTAAPPPPPGQSCGSLSASPPPLSERQPTPPPLAPPVLTQVVKVDAESEDTPPEVEMKPLRRRRRGGVKDEGEAAEVRGRQRRRRRVVGVGAPSVAQDDPEISSGATGLLDPTRKGLFTPHIHVEKKVPEIGAVCTIVNAEEEKMKGERSLVGGKVGLDSLLTSAVSSQLARREKESDKRESDEVESSLQSGKALPSSGHVLPGPVITETNHSGRLLCCLCQKWANFKHLGDLYGPYYPAEYAARLPKNLPQVRQGQTTVAANKTGLYSDTNSNVSSQDTLTQDAQITRPSSESDYAISLLGNSTSPSLAVSGFCPPGGDDMMMMYLSGKVSNSSSTTSKTASLSWDMHLDSRPIPELKREPDVEVDPRPEHDKQTQPTSEPQQRPQHRKLTSHPRFKRRHKSSDDLPRMVPSNSKASLPFQPPPPALDSLGPLAQLAQLPQMPMDPEELWFHEGCIAWTSGVYLVNGRLYGLQEALDGARETSCSYCEMVGSTLGCYTKGCTLRYHYLCAMEADCSMNEENFSLRCPKHKVKMESFPRAAVQQSWCTWSSQREDEKTNKEEQMQESGDWNAAAHGQCF